MHISTNGFQQIEEEVVNAYWDEISNRTFEGETLEGTTYERVDVDDYRERPGTCYLPGAIIQDWLLNDFWDHIDAFLKSEGCKTISEYIGKDQNLAALSPDEYSDRVYSVCQATEDYWKENIYPECVEEYFDEHAEIDYNRW